MQETSASLKRKQENTNQSGLFAFIIYSLESNRYKFYKLLTSVPSVLVNIVNRQLELR